MSAANPQVPITSQARKRTAVRSRPGVPRANARPASDLRRHLTSGFGLQAETVYRPFGAGMKRGIIHFSLPAFLLSSFIFSSCGFTGAQADTAFRSRVESAEITAAGTADKSGNYGGTISTKFNFRDPRRAAADNK